MSAPLRFLRRYLTNGTHAFELIVVSAQHIYRVSSAWRENTEPHD